MNRITSYIISIILISGCIQKANTIPMLPVEIRAVNNDSMSLLLHKITSLPQYGVSGKGRCGDSVYWKILKTGIQIVPLLIDQLENNSRSKIKAVCYEGNLKIYHVAFFMLARICSFGTAAETGMQFDFFNMDCPFPYGFPEYMDKDPAAFKKIVSNWYQKNKNRFSWQPHSDSCSLINGVKGYWSIYN